MQSRFQTDDGFTLVRQADNVMEGREKRFKDFHIQVRPERKTSHASRLLESRIFDIYHAY